VINVYLRLFLKHMIYLTLSGRFNKRENLIIEM